MILQAARKSDVKQNPSPNTMVSTETCSEDHNTESSMMTGEKDIPYQISRPLAVSMSLFGLLHLSGKERPYALFTKVYSTIVLFVLWVMFLRLFTIYGPEGIGPVLFIKVVMHAWSFLCAAAATSTYLACRKKNRLTEFLNGWSNILPLNHGIVQGSEGIYPDRYVRKTKLIFNSCLLVSWIGLFAACGLAGYTNFMTNFTDFMVAPMSSNHPHVFVVKSFLYVIYVYMCAAWVFTLCLFYIIGFVIYEEFCMFHEDFQKAVRSNRNLAEVGKYRSRHQEICLLVEKADGILRVFNAVSIVVSTVIGLLVIYMMIWYQDSYSDIGALVTHMFWLLSCLFYLIIISVGGGLLNHMAHSPLATIHNIRLKGISTETSVQMNMFLSKLTGDSIGLTAMGMFVIDKPTILTIAGAFITYFIVLVQFQQPPVPQQVFVNCSSSTVQ